ncbi:radical SAM protein [Pseudoduganella sp. FT93W]|uniref:Radical SAM protein n=1 Tax=Duganella fentianensis TaxID=2692177 RepID=A0A845I3I8_9BURK|nr:radical SAM protein [Duganella fentianensis]MYN45776.1 radical SAM protein [Duganella fentianensis]
MLRSGIAKFVPHQTLAVSDGVAVLARNSSAWAVMSDCDYELTVQFLKHGVRIEELSAAESIIIEKMWDCGLLLIDAQPISSSIAKKTNVPSSLLLKVTGTCNFACTYCYDFEKDRFSKQLSGERVKETISFLLDQRDDLTITFHGGEPLLRFGLIKEIVDYAMLLAKENRKIVRFAIQTNGSRFTKEVIAFLEEHSFSIGISLDGPDESSNSLRVVRKGNSALACFKELLKNHGKFARERCGLLAVVSAVSLPRIPDFARWLQIEKVQSLSFSFLDNAGAALTSDNNKLSVEEVIGLFKKLLFMIENGDIWELELKSLLSRIDNLNRLVPKDFCHKGPCAASDDFLVLDAEGRYRTCDCVYDKFFEMGEPGAEARTIMINPARSLVEERHHRLGSVGQCKTCPLFGLCGGTCVAKAIASNGVADSVDPIECAISKFIYPFMIDEYMKPTSKIVEYYRYHQGRRQGALQ